ncbi:hypothetical protein POTOM_054357 [Populus tomentosa]|uniref:Uncharacterized protein n=1 Tax=Populus tomentosa TaxID=118781 RepID=A0A8X7Y7E2_POPTO|nr:hypothetical protein POTOM_054357 [Populus tomentosa]
MDITHSIKQFFLSIATLLNLVWGRVRCLLPSPSSNRSPSSPAFDLESPSLEALSQLPPQTPPATDQISQNPETQPPHFENHAPEMLRPPLQPLHPSHATPAPPAIDLESHSQESQAQTSATQETQPLQSTPINTEILSQTAQSQAPQPHSAMETEQQLAPPTQQTPPRAINPRLIHTVVVRRISVEWPNVIMGFCFQAAIQIALQYETTQHSKLPVFFYLRSFSILLTFASLFVSQLISDRFPETSKVLEKVATFLAATAFFTTIATPLTLAFK